MSSTRKTPEHLRPACNSRGEAAEAVEAVEAVEAAGDAAAAAAAAVCRRELAAGARRCRSAPLRLVVFHELLKYDRTKLGRNTVDILVSCRDNVCGRETLLDVSRYPAGTEIPAFSRRLACDRCGRDVDVRPNWRDIR
jgi:hypothetical protein